MKNTNSDRPLVTFALFAYNQEQYIREAVEGAFAQTYSPLEIILSDDCSSDRTFAIMQELCNAYDGPHRVALRQNAVNQGLANHVNEIVRLAKGRYLCVAAGDDISEPDRAEVACRAIAGSRASYFECGYREIDSEGALTGRLNLHRDETIDLTGYLRGKQKRNVGASRTYDLAALRRFPGLLPGCPTEDSTLLLRCLMVGAGLHGPGISIRRRRHGANLSSDQNMRRLPYDVMRDQYLTDIAHASAMGLIGETTRRELYRWAEGWYLYRRSVQDLRNGESKSSVLYKVIIDRAASAYKLRVLRHIVRPRRSE